MRPDLESTILSEIQNSITGIRTHRLKKRLIELGLRDGLDHVTDELLSAQRNQLVRFPGRTWSLPFLPENYAETDATSDDNEFHAERRKPINRTLKAIPGTVIRGTSVATGNKERDLETSDEDNPVSWPIFRRLCDHYIECLRLGAASRASHSADKHTSQFHILKLTSRWWPDSVGSRSIRISRNDLGGDFLNGLAKRTRDPILLGYPLSVSYIPKEDMYLVVPMGILQCEINLDDGALTLTPNATAPILNPDWVRYHQSRKEFRSSLRRLAELTDLGSDDLSYTGREGWADVVQMTQMTQSFLPDQLADRLDPAITSGGLHLGTIDQLQNCVGLFLISENNYTKGSQADLRSLATNDALSVNETSLAGFFAGSVLGPPKAPVAAPFDLSEDQYLAVKDGLSNKVTVISGPPGTGKSQVVASILTSALINGKTALFSSHAHKAIDAVQDRIDELLPDRRVLMRVGGGHADGNTDFKSAINTLIATLQNKSDFDPLKSELQTLLSHNNRIDNIIGLSDEVSGLTMELGACWAEKRTRDISLEDTTATDLSEFNPVTRRWWMRVWQRIMRFFKRTPSEPALAKGLEPSSPHTMSVVELADKIQTLEKRHRVAVSKLAESASSEDLAEELSALKTVISKLYPTAVDQLAESSPEHRERLSELQGAIGLATSRADQLAVWERYADVITRHFPIWSGTALGVPSRIPLVMGLYDYVIIDEATTCNIAQALPLLARARHAIIVGDKMQTGMISDLDPGREREMLVDAGLDAPVLKRFSFSQVSLFDLANSLRGAKRHILRDHFRCDPEIADYISHTFYSGSLLVRTNKSGLRPPAGTRTGLHWTNILGPIESAGRGSRSESEAKAIAEHIEDLIKRQEYKGSIGVVTPFKQQANLIISEIERRLSFEEREACSLSVGTAHKFQGDARDLILISMCYGSSMPRGSLWFLADSTDWLNVAVSRARAVCNIFGNRLACEQSSIRHIAMLAKRVGRRSDDYEATKPIFDSPWERTLFEALRKVGIDTLTQYPLAGRRLDMAIITKNIKLDIEVDGDTYHRDRDGFRKVSDYWRDHVVRSLGWQVQRFWVYELKEDLEGCVERIKQAIGNH